LLALSLLAVWGGAGGCARRPLDQVVQRDLVSRGDLTCRAYLGWNGGDVQHVFVWISGSGVFSSAFVHPSVERALSVNPTAYLTFDKPGIRAPFEDPADLRVADGELQRYTQGHMLECARQAMAWADERFGPTTRFHLRGHSEGTLIALFLLDELLSERPALAARVASVVLSGVGLEPFDELVARQIADLPAERGDALRAAIARCDWPMMKRHFGLSCDYLKDAYARPSGRAAFERIARRGPRIPIFIFQGNNDTNTPARFVRELDAWNSRVGKLDLTVRTYEGAHVGGPAAVKRELSDLLVRLTAAQPRGAASPPP
jgi:pimeloyl-ACP methyl ester carboxylesterase